MVAIQAMLPDNEIAIGVSTTTFSQFFGGTIFQAAAKTMFVNGLRPALERYAPNVDSSKIVGVGATDILKGISPSDYEGVIRAYSEAISLTFVRDRKLPLDDSRDRVLTFGKVVAHRGRNLSSFLQLRIRTHQGGQQKEEKDRACPC
jgi:hypothetical protein